MVAHSYIPDRGDVVWLDFTPHSGHEQMGIRPALVLSPASYNAKTGLAILCPITSRTKGYPFEVPIEEAGVNGVVLSDQVKSLDWRAGRARHVGAASGAVVTAVRQLVSVLLFDS